MDSRFSVRIVAVAAALALVACGGDGGDGGSADAPAFQEEASAICNEQTAAAVRDAELALGDPTAAKSDPDFFSRSITLADEADAKLAALEPPEDTAARYADFVAARQAVNVAREEFLAALESGDENAIAEAEATVGQLDAEAWELAVELGLSGCDYQLSEEEAAEATEVVEQVATSGDGELVCNELLYPELIEDVYGKGGLEACVRGASEVVAEELSVESVNGFDGSFAAVVTVRVGGPRDGLRQNLRLFKDEATGDWRIWEISEIE